MTPSTAGAILRKPTLFTEHFVVYGLEGLAAAHALSLDVGGSDSSVERFQLRQKLSASL
jgi:hypothetical protein